MCVHSAFFWPHYCTSGLWHRETSVFHLIDRVNLSLLFFLRKEAISFDHSGTYMLIAFNCHAVVKLLKPFNHVSSIWITIEGKCHWMKMQCTLLKGPWKPPYTWNLYSACSASCERENTGFILVVNAYGVDTFDTFCPDKVFTWTQIGAESGAWISCDFGLNLDRKQNSLFGPDFLLAWIAKYDEV